MSRKNDVWTEKYRPGCVDDCVLPDRLKSIFKGIVESGTIPNLLLSGSPGIGKTTIAKAICKELDVDFLFLNGSLGGEESGIEAFRTNVRQFASTLSFFDKKKVVIIDEADYLNHLAQPALRGLMEEFAGNCSFIFTCNFKNKLIEPLQSRCSNIDFSIRKEEKIEIISQFVKRVLHILDEEQVEYEDKKIVAEFVVKYYPDFRRCIHELQKFYISYGKIDVGILSRVNVEVNMNALYKSLKSKDFMGMRKWVVEALSEDQMRVYRKIYDSFYEKIKPQSIPPLVVLIAEYQFKSAFSSDQEITLVGFLTEMMIDDSIEFV